MGKSSLMVRTAVRLRREGCAVVVLDLTAVGQNLTVEQWYDGLIERLEHQLDLADIGTPGVALDTEPRRGQSGWAAFPSVPDALRHSKRLILPDHPPG